VGTGSEGGVGGSTRSALGGDEAEGKGASLRPGDQDSGSSSAGSMADGRVSESKGDAPAIASSASDVSSSKDSSPVPPPGSGSTQQNRGTEGAEAKPFANRPAAMEKTESQKSLEYRKTQDRIKQFEDGTLAPSSKKSNPAAVPEELPPPKKKKRCIISWWIVTRLQSYILLIAIRIMWIVVLKIWLDHILLPPLL
jgi:hypothetical protein